MEHPLDPSVTAPLKDKGPDELEDNSTSDDSNFTWQGPLPWTPGTSVSIHAAPVTSLAVSPDSQWLASGSHDTTIVLWEIESQSVVRKWAAHDRTVRHLAFSPDSLRLASSGSEGRVMVWDVDIGELLATMHPENYTRRAVPMVVWSPDGTKLASSSNDGTVRIWDAQTYKSLHVLQHPGSQDASVLFSHCGRYLASGGAGYTCRVWNVDNGTLYRELKGRRDDRDGGPYPGTGRITTAVFDPQDCRIAAASRDGRLWIWDVDTGEELMTLHEHHGLRRVISFSPGDGKYILSASSDSTLKVCDSSTGEWVVALEGHDGVINSATFSPDGRYVASASSDNTVRLWRRSDGTHLKTFDEHNGKVTHVLFSPDGETLSSGSDDGTVRIRVLKDFVQL